MGSHNIPSIGMRKVKSIFALIFAFFIWQLVRIFFPQLDIHPLFGYVYAIIEMRESVDKTKTFGLFRIKATFIGLTIGLCVLAISGSLGKFITNETLIVFMDLALIAFGALIALWFADLFKCKNLCGIAAIIVVICMVRDRDSDINIYLYAILRALQTLLGVFAAWFVNKFICAYPKKSEKVDAKE